ncbi:S-layer homology domain-containing protein [Cohnella sp. GbtcB17]|uniref:S-layer homology domain-containing protein n=1 Tax=Cohnella sp. GbtcB17 TaxID=2824762 RepID=UPI001C30BDCF
MVWGKRIRLPALALAVSMLGAGWGGAAWAAGLPSHWAQDTLNAWVNKGWLAGGGNGGLQPDQPITRAEFATLAVRAFGLQAGGAGAGKYSDVREGSWYAGAIYAAAGAGILSGYPDGTIRPSRSVTREEAAVVLAKLDGLSETEAVEPPFSDAADLRSWSRASVGSAVYSKLLGGYPDGTFRPAKAMTRAEAIVALDKAWALRERTRTIVYDKAGVYGPAEGTQEIAGSVSIAAPGVTLRNTVVRGDLTIGAEVGEGDAQLEGVTVDGKLTVAGGGEHSVHLTNAKLGQVVVNKLAGKLRLVLEGSTFISQLDFRTQGSLVVPPGSSVGSLNVFAILFVTGSGNIGNAHLFVSGSSFEHKPGTIEREAGVLLQGETGSSGGSASPGGPAQTPAPTPTPSPSEKPSPTPSPSEEPSPSPSPSADPSPSPSPSPSEEPSPSPSPSEEPSPSPSPSEEPSPSPSPSTYPSPSPSPSAEPSPSPSPSADPSPTPSPTGEPSPSPSPSAEPSPSPSPSADPSPTPSPTGEPSPSPSPSEEPSPTPSPTGEPSPSPSPSADPSPTPSPSADPSPTPSPSEEPTPGPIITGVKDGTTYTAAVTPELGDDSDIASVELTKDGELVADFELGGELSESGNYVLTVANAAGETTVVHFKLAADVKLSVNDYDYTMFEGILTVQVHIDNQGLDLQNAVNGIEMTLPHFDGDELEVDYEYPGVSDWFYLARVAGTDRFIGHYPQTPYSLQPGIQFDISYTVYIDPSMEDRDLSLKAWISDAEAQSEEDALFKLEPVSIPLEADSLGPISDLAVEGGQANEASTVTLTFSEPVGETTYGIEYDDGSFGYFTYYNFDDLEPDTNRVTIKNLKPGRSYQFRLVVFDGYNKGRSNVVEYTTPDLPPLEPNE